MKKKGGVSPGLESSLEILKTAIKRTKGLDASKFDCEVHVRHQDGSSYDIEDVCAEYYKGHLIVYLEHGVPMVFCLVDLKKWELFDRKGHPVIPSRILFL